VSRPECFTERSPHTGAKEKLHAFLETRPAGADARELVGLLFMGAGSDPELGARLVQGLIGGDPNFIFEAATGLWSLRRSAALRVPWTKRASWSSTLKPPAGAQRPVP